MLQFLLFSSSFLSVLFLFICPFSLPPFLSFTQPTSSHLCPHFAAVCVCVCAWGGWGWGHMSPPLFSFQLGTLTFPIWRWRHHLAHQKRPKLALSMLPHSHSHISCSSLEQTYLPLHHPSFVYLNIYIGNEFRWFHIVKCIFCTK